MGAEVCWIVKTELRRERSLLFSCGFWGLGVMNRDESLYVSEDVVVGVDVGMNSGSVTPVSPGLYDLFLIKPMRLPSTSRGLVLRKVRIQALVRVALLVVVESWVLGWDWRSVEYRFRSDFTGTCLAS